MKEVFSEIEIQAHAEHVMEVLTDFASYPEWSPFIRRISGQPKEGNRLKVYIEPPGAKGRTFRPEVLKAEPSRDLRWLGRLLIPGLFDGDHIFTTGQTGSEACPICSGRNIFRSPCFFSPTGTGYENQTRV